MNISRADMERALYRTGSKQITVKEHVEAKVIEWYDLPIGERIPKKELARMLHIQKLTIDKIVEKLKYDKAHDAVYDVKTEYEPPKQKISADKQGKKFLSKLYGDVMKENCSPAKMELYAKIYKLIPDTKIEVRHGITADELARQYIEATRELRDTGYGTGEVGMVKVSEESVLLHDELRSGSGQGTAEGSPVETVASPETAD